MSMTPQIEDGHIKIANELFDAILKYPFTARQQKVVMAIIRKTYGFNKKQDDVSASQIADLCGVRRNHVTTTLNELAEINVISKTVGEYGSLVGINKKYRTWGSPKTGHLPSPNLGHPLSQIGTPKVADAEKSENEDNPLIVKDSSSPKTGQVSQLRTCPDLGQVASPDLGHTKDNLPKDIKPLVRKGTQVVDIEFEKAWAMYPKREGGNSKADAKKAWNARLREGVAAASMIAGIKRYSQQMQDAGNVGTKFVKMASTFLGPGHHFESESQATALESAGASWWQRAGFEREWQAINAGATEKTAHLYRNGELQRHLLAEGWQ